MIIAKNITNNVYSSVWIAALIKTYQNFVLEGKKDYWLSQKEIQEIARELCPKNIDIARIHQWCNGDHPNNTYNYLRADGKFRRITKVGEFSNYKEQPTELPIDELIFKNNNVKLINLIDWYKEVYCKIQFDKCKKEKNTKSNKNLEYNAVENEKNEQNFYNINEEKNLIDEVLYDSQDIKIRAIALIKVAWEIFSRKVGNGLILINKEASMQLEYSYILKHMLPLIIFEDDENIEIELETTVNDGTKNREVDIMTIVSKGNEVYKIALELKCYRKKASSGGKRGATDIFMKNVYQDIYLLECYCEHKQADVGIALVMNDYKNFVYPKKKDAKCWVYDISQDTKVSNVHLTTPIGGNDIDITLEKEYEFKWKEIGGFWFLFLIPM